jgi:hypothetical protein
MTHCRLSGGPPSSAHRPLSGAPDPWLLPRPSGGPLNTTRHPPS